MADTTLREGFREVRDQARPSEINPKLEEAVQNQPLLPHLLSYENILKALAAGAVVALLLFLIASPMFAGVGLLLVFFGTWIGLSVVSYGKAEDRKAAEKAAAAEDE